MSETAEQKAPLGPDVLMYALDVLASTQLEAGHVAGCLRKTGSGDAPDRVVALCESLSRAHPELFRPFSELAAHPRYQRMRCHACRAAFRVPPGYVPRQATCPACGDALTRLTTLPSVQMPRRAAEGGAPPT